MAFGGIGVRVDDEWYIRLLLSKFVEQMYELLVYNYGIYLCEGEDVRNVFSFQPIVDSYVNCSGGSNTEYAFEERGGVWSEYANSLEIVFYEIICQSSCPIEARKLTPYHFHIERIMK